jgi:3D (Asp-Asp-Asp) domain-containing protein
VVRSAPVRGVTPGFRGRVAAVSLAAGLLLSVPAGSGADPTTRASKLQRQGTAIASRAHRALLDLYSLETQLADARSRLGSLQVQAGRVRAEQALVRRQVGITQHALTVSQRTLAARLKLLYEQGQPDSIAVILGATSLDDAINHLEDINRSARQSQSVIEQTTSTRRALGRLSAKLQARRNELSALQQQAAASAAALERTRSERTRFLASLRTRAQMNRIALASLEATAQAAQAKSAALTSAVSSPANVDATTTAAATDAAAGVAAAPTPALAPASGGHELTVSSTGYSLPGTTATGLPVGWGIVAVDPSVIPLGTHMTIPGYGEAVAADTGSAVRGASIDLWFPSLAQARAWGRRTVTITLH